MLKGNGYLAVYLAGLVIGNSKVVHKRSMETFFDGLTWLFQIVMFLTLGLLVTPSQLPPIIGIGLAIGVFMIVLARPITIFLCLLPFKNFTTRARLYISWVGLRGAGTYYFRDISHDSRHRKFRSHFQHRVFHHSHLLAHTRYDRRDNGQMVGAHRSQTGQKRLRRTTARRNKIVDVGNRNQRPSSLRR